MARFDRGWIKLWRISLDKDLSQNIYLWSIWHALLHMAVWKETQIIWEGEQKVLKPGSVIFGLREFSIKWECSKSTISRWLKYLSDTGRIVYTTCPRGSLVTICNWDSYQTIENESHDDGEHKLATKCPQSVHKVAISEEGKKERKKEEYNTSSFFDLESAYKKYPLKQGKTPGLKKLRVQIKTQVDFDSLIQAIERYTESPKVQQGFIMNFATFVNQWRDWTDEEAGTSSVDPNGPVDYISMIQGGRS